MSQQSNIQVQPRFYEYEPSSVEEGLWAELRNPDDRPLLLAIFQSPEWRSQSLPIPDNLMRQLRHDIEISSGRVYTCPFCSVLENEANHMTEHIQEHFGLKPFDCRICGHTSRRNSDLQGHIKTHNPQEITCPKGCGQTFTAEKNIKRHLAKSCPRSAV